jgi:hypothetical protein
MEIILDLLSDLNIFKKTCTTDYLLIYLFIYLFIHSFIHSCIHYRYAFSFFIYEHFLVENSPGLLHLLYTL